MPYYRIEWCHSDGNTEDAGKYMYHSVGLYHCTNTHAFMRMAKLCRKELHYGLFDHYSLQYYKHFFENMVRIYENRIHISKKEYNACKDICFHCGGNADSGGMTRDTLTLDDHVLRIAEILLEYRNQVNDRDTVKD